ncbi:hypothetical protein DRJ54_04000 [Candidatus Acetothermia bacterium]|nr:MAG: hypothetical protein DRJ54_04000 [Candidatus Acetothermia bacterium]
MERLKRALKFAVEKEKEAEAFYRKWAEEAQDPGVRQLFSELASWERGHAEKVSRIKPEELASQGTAPQDLKISDLLVEVPASPDMTLTEALVVAMKREQSRPRWNCMRGWRPWGVRPRGSSPPWPRRSAATSAFWRTNTTTC